MLAVPGLDLPRIRNYCDSRVAAHLRDEARIEADVHGKSVTIFDCRPPLHPNLTEWSRVPVVQLRYDPDSRLWTLYRADRNSRWHRYDDVEPGTADELLTEINEDPTCVFWGWPTITSPKGHFSTTPRGVIKAFLSQARTTVRARLTAVALSPNARPERRHRRAGQGCYISTA